MPHNPGIIYETDKGDYALAINREQHAAFEAVKKVCVHLFVDRLCTVPKLDVTGKQIMILKSVDKLTMIGFSD
jgi:hypothetical protein